MHLFDKNDLVDHDKQNKKMGRWMEKTMINDNERCLC